MVRGKRLVLSLGEIYRRNDVDLDMVEIYFHKTLTRLGDEKSNNLVSHIQKFPGKVADHASIQASPAPLSHQIS